MTVTRGQAKRALEWVEYLKVQRIKRRGAPPCVTCGAVANHFMAKGEPGYPCDHPPLRIDDETMARARAELRR